MSIQTEIGKPDFRYSVKYHDAVNSDIQKVLEAAFPKAVKEAAPIAYRFKGADRIDTAKNIYNYLKNEITYQKDPEGYQDIRYPRFFHHTRVADCKSFTLNTLSIYHNIYPQDRLYFFYAGYDGGNVPTHVYALIEPKGQSPIIIDGCWYFFNSEKNYTLGFKSKNMQVRELSGIEGNARPEAAEAFDRIYKSLDAKGKEQFKQALRDRLHLEIIKYEHGQGTMNGAQAYKEICMIEGLGIGRRGKGKLGRKLLHWFNAAALFLGRAAFLLFVTLNVNALASKLDKLIKWGKFDRIDNIWYILGGNTKKFKQIIQRGAKKKKLWLSHKAHVRYNEKFEGRDDHGNKLKGVDAIESHEIGAAPVAAAAVAAIPVLASLIPKMIEAFKSATATQPQAAAEANEMANQGNDLVQSAKDGGYQPNAGTIDVMLPPGQTAELGNTMPAAARAQAGSSDFDFSSDDENLYGIGDFNDVMTALTPALGSLATVGMSELGKVISRSKNKTVHNIGEIGDAAAAGYAAQRGGYTQDAQYLQKVHREGRRKKISPVMLLGGAALLLVGAKVLMTTASAPAQYQAR
jgi:hypothetical protein